MSAAQLLSLLLGQTLQTVIALSSGPNPVLPRTVQDAKQGAACRDDLANEVDGVASVILGTVVVDVGPTARRVSI